MINLIVLVLKLHFLIELLKGVLKKLSTQDS